MTLITVMGYSNFLLFKMLWHTNNLYRFPWSGLNDFIVTSQTELGDFLIMLNRQRAYLLIIFDVVAVGTMADLAGD